MEAATVMSASVSLGMTPASQMVLIETQSPAIEIPPRIIA